MKVVIWCGGRGVRLNEMTEFLPKPIIKVGDNPILWHIMKIYSHYGFKEFVLCLGYKGDMIKDYFVNYPIRNYDFTHTINLKDAFEMHSNVTEDWKITFADTGLDTLTGGRLLKVKKFLENEDMFMITYGDGLADIDINRLVEFHKQKGKMVTVTGGRKHSNWGIIKIDSDNIVESFQQKPLLEDYINIGFMIFNKEIFDFIKEDVEIEEVLRRLSANKQVAMFPHDGFFHSMDTYKEYTDLNTMWNSGNIPWKIWDV